MIPFVLFWQYFKTILQVMSKSSTWGGIGARLGKGKVFPAAAPQISIYQNENYVWYLKYSPFVLL